MNRGAKLVMVVLVAGAMASAVIGIAITQRRVATPVATPSRSMARAADRATLERCRVTTTADSGCTAAWQAERQRFFGRTKP